MAAECTGALLDHQLSEVAGNRSGSENYSRYCVEMSTIVLALVIFVLSLLGGLAPIGLSATFDDDRMRLLTSLGGGFLLASALLIVLPEGFHAAEGAEPELSELTLGAALLGGFLIMLLSEGFGLGHSVHEEHHDHSEAHGHGHIHHPEGGLTLPLGLSIHAAADGLAIGAAAASTDGAAAALIAVAVLLHKVPAAFSLGTFASHERRERSKAVLDVVGFSLVTPLALVAASLLLDGEQSWLAVMLLFSAGTFLYVATVDTLPAIHARGVGRRTAFDVLIGAALFAALLWLLSATGLVTDLH